MSKTCRENSQKQVALFNDKIRFEISGFNPIRGHRHRLVSEGFFEILQNYTHEIAYLLINTRVSCIST